MRQLNKGVTLIELMVAVAIMALLSMAALPALGDYQANSRLREGANAVMAAAITARNEALKQNRAIALTLKNSADGARLEIAPASVAIDAAKAAPRSVTLPAGVLLEFSAPLVFTSSGLLDPFGGSVTVTTSTPNRVCDGDLRCPAVRVEAGGDAQICPTGVCS